MTDYPCLVDTDSIAQSVTSAGYQADLRLDPATDNALEMRPAGLAVRLGVAHSARIAASGNTNIVDGAQAVAFNVVRWDTTGVIAQANALRTDAPGLWLFGACISCFGTSGAAFGNFIATITDTGGGGYGDIAYDTAYSGQAAYTPGLAQTGTAALNPACLVELPSGAQFGVNVNSNFGGGVLVPANQIIGSSSPPLAVASRNEMAGIEFWCALVRPL